MDPLAIGIDYTEGLFIDYRDFDAKNLNKYHA